MADNDIPGADFPFLDQAIHDIRVFAGKGFNFTFVVNTKDNQRAVGGIVEGAAENQFAAVAMLSRDVQMLFAEFRAARHVIVHGFIDQSVVVHRIRPHSRTQAKGGRLGRLSYL